MRVLQCCSGRFPVVLEDQNVLESPILFQIKNAVPKGPQHVFNLFGRKCRQGCIVVVGLDDDLMRAHAIHLVEHAFGLSIEVALNSQCRKFVRHHPNRPTRSIRLRLTSVLIGTVGLYLWGSLALVAGAERAESAPHLYRITGKIGGTLGAVARNNHPAADDGVFSEFGQTIDPPPAATRVISFYDESAAFWNSSKVGWAKLWS